MKQQLYDGKGRAVRDNTQSQFRRALTSALLLIIAFAVSRVVFQLMTFGVAKLIGFPAHVNFNNVFVSRDWQSLNRTRIIAVYFSIPVFCMFISLILFRGLKRSTNWINTNRLFIFWLMVCFANIFFANLIIAPLGMNDYSTAFYDNFAVVAAWMKLNSVVMTGISIATVIVTILFGVWIGMDVLRFSFSSNYILTQWGKRSIMLQVFVLPLLLAFLPLILLGNGLSSVKIALMIVSLGIISLGMLIRGTVDHSVVKCKRSDVLNHTPFTEFVIAACLWAVLFIFFRG